MEEKELTLEESFAKIEEILTKMESDQTSLEDSFALYEAGIGQIKHCNARMDEVEQKVRKLAEDGTLVDFSEV